ncbi:MAG: glycosyltransferase family 4 protein [Patescibacteria group bacterium]|nr:glycosyltransferase family 4 protein [Patescibacteria group bacterium]MCL5431606.1 glycosyltransferase family 4 protein [Patescibacteria group bacterium]
MKKSKILFVLPKDDSSSASNYFAIHEFLEKVSDWLDITKIDTGANLLARFFWILVNRLRGCRKIFVYYSYADTIFASFVTKVFGGKTYFWHCYWHGDKYKRFWRYPSLWLLAIALKTCDCLVTGTKTMGNAYQQAFHLPKNKIKIFPSWVNIDRFIKTNKRQARKALEIPLDKKVIFIFPRLTISKGADWLPAIMINIAHKVPNVLFLIVEKGELSGWLNKEIKTVSLDELTRFVPPVSNSEVPKYFNAADLYLLPSRGEGFPRPILEAMATGVPFVAFDAGGTHDILSIKQQQCLAPIGNTMELASIANKILSKPPLWKQLSAEGKRQVKKFSMENISRDFISLVSF